ncbi:hypothetical protein L1987_32804 [Smallanthus sonchifolius]|uniref:Uncharacterized protein n=1 Tax=Smallanthus sonchifolius TaxID=185202 RepID=A0ACB9HQM3_9ASTR|nr:hypothetical protein L1987_32804 [Smallanthus sonchifolius]
MADHNDIEMDQLDDLAHYPFLDFPPDTEAFSRCQKLREVQMGPGTAVDWALLEEVQEAERARAIIGEDTPWSRLFDLSFAETYRELVVEFLSTFIYSETGLQPLPGEAPDIDPDRISFSIFGVVYRQTLSQWAVTTGLYYEPETVTPLFTEAVTEVDKEELLVFWGLISDSPWLGTKGRVSGIRDPLYRYLHRLISTSIAPRLKSREWCTDRDLFFLFCLLTGRRCDLSTSMALYFASAYMRQKRGLLYGGAFITHIMRSVLPFDQHEPAMLPAIPPVRLDRRTASGMRITHRFPQGLRFVGAVQDQVWVPVPLPQMPGQGDPHMPQPLQGIAIEDEPPHVEQVHEHPPQHPRHVRRSVRLDRATQAVLDGLVADSRRQGRQLDRMEDLMMWAVGQLVNQSRAAGIEPPPLPPPRHYPDDPVQGEGGAGQGDAGAGQGDGGDG